MKTKLFHFTSATAIVFAVAAASSSTSLAKTDTETLGKYYQAMACGASMGVFTVMAQRINDKKLETAFKAATDRHMQEIMSLGAKLEKSDSAAIDEFRNYAQISAKQKSSYSESEIETITTSCAPEILPLLK